jgi:hypothetical protein
VRKRAFLATDAAAGLFSSPAANSFDRPPMRCVVCNQQGVRAASGYSEE